MKIFRYKFLNFPLLHRCNAEQILQGKTEISFDLGLTKEKIEYCNDSVKIRNLEVGLNRIEEIAKDKRDNIFAITEQGILKLLFFQEKVYKLRMIKPDTAPTLEINGIHMHRIKDTTPWEDSKRKVLYLDVKDKDVLDVCTGLGYTAILSKKLGAKSIVTIENDINVLKIAEFNPWSKELEKIKIINEDALKTVRLFEDKRFDRILLDPPRESLARELYSRKFYAELKRILISDGILLHYVGSPGMKKGAKFEKQIEKRLKEVGFREIEYVEEVQSLLVRN